MASTKEGICILCQLPKTLCQSHIIPEFCHTSIYDDKHRAYSFSPVTPEKTRFMQKGLRTPLLCAECEGKINDWYEKPFRKFWIEDNALAPLACANHAILTGVPYEPFKLFHLSVLLRAAESDHPNFSEVVLGTQIDELRRMVRDRQAGPDTRYQIVCSAIEGENGAVWHDLIGPAHRIVVGDAVGFYFTFGGAQWFYYVEGTTPDIDRICLKANGTLPVVKKPWKAIEKYREAMK